MVELWGAFSETETNVLGEKQKNKKLYLFFLAFLLHYGHVGRAATFSLVTSSADASWKPGIYTINTSRQSSRCEVTSNDGVALKHVLASLVSLHLIFTVIFSNQSGKLRWMWDNQKHACALCTRKHAQTLKHSHTHTHTTNAAILIRFAYFN